MKTIICLLLSTSISIAQTVYDIPFPEGKNAQQGNVIELSVANNSTTATEGIKVELADAPAWLKFNPREQNITELKPTEEKIANFVFFVEKNAEVNKEQTLRFKITDQTGQSWNKEIRIKILPPTTFELYQNYPNPFNPTTTIAFMVPSVGNSLMKSLQLKIYDIIGREVANLINEPLEAGYHEVKFNAQNLASGVYFYQLIIKDEQNKTQEFRKKMILLR